MREYNYLTFTLSIILDKRFVRIAFDIMADIACTADSRREIPTSIKRSTPC